ncbi:plasmid maintenance protein (macronuclear) [Tetrahymena thermophila SB210]|uniref:Mannosyltransferase n=1 Tax=Tetrahymena thermophila (strain SB210) TaxID=312017 RepID=Q23DV3_TETTS|nr:plasmid maintenance protein [Tetrahymena thermophila SB210]EAR94611.1 plasmid maintenance protein [Tetrahymena thermophila SB210]|eukprot:XP_001014583.1 plasmid maintenance protein [Tetrahymena thermophila SB210]
MSQVQNRNIQDKGASTQNYEKLRTSELQVDIDQYKDQQKENSKFSEYLSNLNFKQHFILFYIFRLINCSLINNSWAADEYWQSAEVAHRNVFGYGNLTWEWQIEKPIRSPVIMLMVQMLYSLLKVLNLDTPDLVAYSPMLISAFIASIYDFYLIKLVQICLGKKFVLPCLIINQTLWFNLIGMPRLLANSLETCLLVVSFYYYQSSILNKSSYDDYISRVVVIINFVTKPTSIIPFIFIWPITLLTMQGNLKKKFNYLVLNIFTVILMIAFSILLDSLYYQKLTWTAYNFFEFNILNKLSNLYGTQDPFFYLWAVIPKYYHASLPLIFYGLIKYYQHVKKSQNSYFIIYSFFVLLALYSKIDHKEDRFILPCNIGLTIFVVTAYTYLPFSKIKKLLLAIFILVNIILFVYEGQNNQAAGFKVMNYLRNQGDKVKSIYMFTTCNQTPFYCYLHKNIPMHYPECHALERVKGEYDNLTLFKQPENFITERLNQYDPSHLIVLSYFLEIPSVNQIFQERGYQEEYRQFHERNVGIPIGEVYDKDLVVMSKKILKL